MAETTFRTIPAMRDAAVLAVETEAPGFPLRHALDNNLNLAFKQEAQTDHNLDLDLGEFGEEITAIGDRDFSAATNWSQQTMNTFNKVTDLSLTATAADQYCQLDAAGFDGFVRGRTYRITYDYTESIAGFKFQTGTADQVIGTAVAGSAETLEFQCTESSTTLEIVSLTTTASGDFDNISIVEVDSEDERPVDGVALFIVNHDTDHKNTTSAQIKLSHSYDGLTWTLDTTDTLSSAAGYTIGEPLFIGSNLSVQTTARYWRITLASFNTKMEIGRIMLYREIELDRPAERETKRSFDAYRNEMIPGGGANSFTVARLRKAQVDFTRLYHLASNTEVVAIEDLFNDCRGRRYPFIFEENGLSQPVLARLITDIPEWSDRNVDIRDAYILFRAFIFVDDGEAF